MTRLLALLVLVVGLAAGLSASAQGPRVDAPRGDPPRTAPPPAGAVPFGPFPVAPADPNAPPSVPNRDATPELIVDLSRPRVSITSAFQGESLLMFGMFDPPGEIVVVVAGPPARETVLRKQRVLGLWLNTGRQAFDDVPAYYFIAASQQIGRAHV